MADVRSNEKDKPDKPLRAEKLTSADQVDRHPDSEHSSTEGISDHLNSERLSKIPPGSAQETRTQLLNLHQTARLETTLFDMAKQSLNERKSVKDEPDDKNHVYLELDRIMGLNGYPHANLTGKLEITDSSLPNAWNSVHAHQEFKLYESGKPGEPSAEERQARLEARLKEQIKSETTTIPVQPGWGYYDVWAHMHPELTPDKINQDAHRIKAINGNRDVLKVGERLATATEAEREAELRRRLQQQPEITPKESQAHVPPSKPNAPADKIAPPKTLNPEKTTGPKSTQTPPPYVGTGGGTTAPKPSDGATDLISVYKNLLQQHNEAASSLSKDEKSQGIIGKAFDAAKNNIGTSAEGKAWYDPRRMWSGLFDNDLGSETMDRRIKAEQTKLDRMKEAVDAKDTDKFAAAYKDLTGQEFDAKNNLVAPIDGNRAAQAYDQSQHNGVDNITDVGVAIAVAATMRTGKAGLTKTFFKGTGAGAIIGGLSKAGMMQIDGRYADIRHDLAGGALMGAIVPIGELGGSQISKVVGKRMGATVTGNLLSARIETQGASFGTKLISAAAKSGASGAIFGAIDGPARETMNDLEQGRQLNVGDLAATSLKGSVLGFVGGTILGGSMDAVSNGFRYLRPGAVTSAKTIVDGVEVPTSGAIGLDHAAKILKMSPADLTEAAKSKPYNAVAEAVKLYEKTGLNIKKSDPLTGASVLPEPFHEALNTVQNVDLLTADSATKLSAKVHIVDATDQFLKNNPEAVNKSITSLEADSNYREVVKLKAARDGEPAAQAFQQNFRGGFATDLKTAMAVKQVSVDGLKPAEALTSTQPEVEALYKQKAADFFADMTDPAQRIRLNELVDDIHARFNPETLKKTDIEGMLEAVPQADRELAVALLHESAGVSSDVMLKARFQALKGDIAQQVGSSSPSDVYTLAPDSSANLLGYLYRKSNSLSMDMHNIDKLATQIKSGYVPHSVVLFDDLSTTPISQANQQMLSKVPRVYVVDVGGFEKAVNIIDVSKGPQVVAEKLSRLLEEARAIRDKNPGMLASGIARETLQSGVDNAAKTIGENVKIIRPGNNLQIQNATAAGDLAKMDDVDALYAQYNIEKATKPQIANFLSGYVGEERELAARMLAEGAVHNSFSVMVQKAADLNQKLTEALNGSGMKMSDLLVVSDKDPGGSTHLISYLFGKVNGLSSDNFISSQGLNQMIAGGQVKDKAIAYFDDTIYSGSQATQMLNNNVSSLMPFKKVVIASLGAYDKGVQSIKGTHLASLGKVEVTTSSNHQPFYSQNHPFYSQLGGSQRNAVKQIGGSDGFGSVQGSLIWSYMYPDNNLTFFGPQFSGTVLRLPGP
jgi:hypothetical protein